MPRVSPLRGRSPGRESGTVLSALHPPHAALLAPIRAALLINAEADTGNDEEKQYDDGDADGGAACGGGALGGGGGGGIGGGYYLGSGCG